MFLYLYQKIKNLNFGTFIYYLVGFVKKMRIVRDSKKAKILMGRTFLGRLRHTTVSHLLYVLKLNTDYAKLLRNFNRIFPKINKSINNRFRKNLQKSELFKNSN